MSRRVSDSALWKSCGLEAGKCMHKLAQQWLVYALNVRGSGDDYVSCWALLGVMKWKKNSVDLGKTPETEQLDWATKCRRRGSSGNWGCIC